MNKKIGATTAEFEKVIIEYINWIKKIFPRFDELKNPGTTVEIVNKIEEQMNIKFPEDLKQLYMIINGDNKHAFGFVLGLNMLSVEEMYTTWKLWRKFDEDKELNDQQYYSSLPQKAIKCRYTNPLWIPIAHDCSSNYFGIDLDPDINGTIGQIINFGRDENDKKVFANSLKKFFELGLKLKAEMQIEEIEKDVYFITNKDGKHAIDWLKKK
ncbi:SMI1/KNR4 family protein [Desnuesiella massiliensis]|uniref:SMI1/KNR4 family protein n=1 Tax=Desnuesiella massiliensis TaxID=1650662 RepID=UPI0006E372C4|nr:SMI1/KNR4 family protein [Desnuesiella massiliensis]